ncbi:MAG: hypothetical protein IAF38_03995 [Bacteroidia bacterium]|nr:hypothetical protein [Bacteroidia bacterium]
MSSPSGLFIRTLLFLVGIPLYIGGLITNYLPYYASWKIAEKLLKGVEWYAAVAMLLGTFFFGLYYIGQFITVWCVFHDWRIFISFLPMPFLLGWFSVHYSPFRKKLFGSFRMKKLKKNKTEYDKIKWQREEIIREITFLLL